MLDFICKQYPSYYQMMWTSFQSTLCSQWTHMQVRFAFQKVENRHSANAQQSKILIVGVITHCQKQKHKWTSEIFWHKGASKSLNEHENPIFEWSKRCHLRFDLYLLFGRRFSNKLGLLPQKSSWLPDMLLIHTHLLSRLSLTSRLWRCHCAGEL